MPVNNLPGAIPDLMERFGGAVLVGDALDALEALPSNSVHCCVTSPPYWGLRNYELDGQIGLEDDLNEYLGRLLAVFKEVMRVLTPDGTLWLNIGDSYTSGNRGWRAPDKRNPARGMKRRPPTPPGLKDKELVGIPWRLAFALQAQGWYLRSDLIWNKPNGQPESVKDRPIVSHEYLFLLSKSKRYQYFSTSDDESQADFRRSVWSIKTEPYKGAHFAPFPTELVRNCLTRATTRGQLVIDPFFGSGTVGLVCRAEGRRFLGIELNPAYVKLLQDRIGLTGECSISVGDLGPQLSAPLPLRPRGNRKQALLGFQTL